MYDNIRDQFEYDPEDGGVGVWGPNAGFSDFAVYGVVVEAGQVVGLRSILRTSNNEAHFAVRFRKKAA